MCNRQKLRQCMTIHCLSFIALSKNKKLSQMKYLWIDKSLSLKTLIHILKSMLYCINCSCRNIPICCKFCKMFNFSWRVPFRKLYCDMNIHFSYYEIPKHHLTKMHTWFNIYYSVFLANFVQNWKNIQPKKLRQCMVIHNFCIIAWSKYNVPLLQMKYHQKEKS